MGACHVHRVPETGCTDCLQDERDCLRADVNQLRATLQIASSKPEGERCVRCSWMGDEVLKECWPCKEIRRLTDLLELSRLCLAQAERIHIEQQRKLWLAILAAGGRVCIDRFDASLLDLSEYELVEERTVEMGDYVMQVRKKR